MRFFIDLKRELKEAIISFKRNGIMSLGCIIISTIALLSLGVTLLVSVYGNYAVASIGNRLKVTAFFRNDATEEQVNEVVLRVKSLPQIKEIVYISPEKALEELKQNFEDLDTLETSSIPPSIRITPKNSKEINYIIEEIEKFPQIESINDVSDIANSYSSMVRIVTIVSISIIIFFFTGFIFMISSATNLAIYSFRKEIEIMQLIGSSRAYVRNPFLFLGGFYGLIGAIISSLLMFPVSKEVDKIYRSFIFYVPIEFVNLRILIFICASILIIGLMGGIAASAISVRKYLK